jgi:ABC-type glycerol-3-phosphate transport system substrate-binding protein
LLLLITTVLAAISMRHRLAQGRRLKPALALGALLLLAALFGCGGGGGSGPPIVQNPQGTPAGTYTVTVNAASPNANASTPVTLIVK